MTKTHLYTIVYDSQKKTNLITYIFKMYQELKIYRYAYFNFVSGMLSSRYRRSTLGFFWALLNPLFNLTVLAFIFSLVFKQDLRTFGVYVFSALSPWMFISTCLSLSPNAFIQNESYLKKVYIPKIIFPLTLISVEVINFFFSLIAIYIIFILVGSKISWVTLLLPFPIIITFVFMLGLGMFLSVAQVYFRDIGQIISVSIGALMYTVPIIYPMTTIPVQLRPILYFNPLFQVINLFRALIYDVRVPEWYEWLIPSVIALLSFLLGCYVLMKNENDLVFRL